MRASEHYRSEVDTVAAEASVRDAALRMRDDGVGCLVVVEEGKPAGMLTDRDLLRRVVAARRHPDDTRVRDVMSAPLVSVSADQPLEQVVEAVSRSGIRRVPLLRDGHLAGLVTLDDVLAGLTDELSDLVEGIRSGVPGGGLGAARLRRLASDIEGAGREIGRGLERVGNEAWSELRRRVDRLRERRGDGDD